MSTLLCMRRRGGTGSPRRHRPDVDLLSLWYVEGFAVVCGGREVGVVDLVLPTLDGDRPGALVLFAADGTGAIADVADVDAVKFGRRLLSVVSEPVPFEVGEGADQASPRDFWPASA